METRKKILIVDDEQINLEFFDLMLTKLGFVVEKAGNGYEALEKVKETNPDLIMLDNIMPRLSGWEVTRLLKTSDEYAQWRDIPVIMFSAMDDVKDKIEGFELGIEDYITKPFNFSEVLARIRAVLRNHELILQLKKRESRLELEEKANALLVSYAQESYLLLEDLRGGNYGADAVNKKLDEVKAKYESLRDAIDNLREERLRLKHSEINVVSLEKELRKSYSE